MSFSSRFKRVSSFLALMIHQFHGFAVGRWLRLKVTPCSLVVLQKPIVQFFQFHTSLFVRVDAGFSLSSGFIGFEAGCLHASLLDKHLGMFDIDAAPDTAGFARRAQFGDVYSAYFCHTWRLIPGFY